MTTNASTSLFEQVHAAHPEWRDDRVVRHICERLLDEGELEPPVDVDLLASLCGIAEIAYRFAGPTGMLLCREGRWVASVRRGDGLERQRFTILHEGGHTMLPDFKRGGEFHRCGGPRTRVEQLCDLAAAEMLLPRRFFTGDLRPAAQISDVDELARHYMASVQATTHRVVDLSTTPQLMMVFHLAHKPQERGQEDVRPPRLRLEYAHSNQKLPYPLRDKSVPDDSALQRAWAHEEVNEPMILDAFFAEPVGQRYVTSKRYGEKIIALAQPLSTASRS